MKKIVLLMVMVCCLAACQKSAKVVSKTSQIHMIDSTLDALQDTQYVAYLKPIKTDLENKLSEVIGYTLEPLGVFQPECPMLNWATDALLYMAKKYCPDKVDIAVVNIGGMRCSWGQGDITIKHVFELMPFDNELVVLTLTGQDILDLCQVFAKTGGEGAAGMQIAVRNGVVDAKINNKMIDPSKTYLVATSDYLSQGNDYMTPLTKSSYVWKSNMKIRDLYLEYIKEKKLVEAVVDGRFVIDNDN